MTDGLESRSGDRERLEATAESNEQSAVHSVRRFIGCTSDRLDALETQPPPIRMVSILAVTTLLLEPLGSRQPSLTFG
jgi:hypothetical protein